MAKQEYLQDLVIKLEPISSEKLEEVLLREKRNALKFCTLSGVTIKDEPDEQIPSYSFPRDFEGFEDESELIFYSLGSDTQQVYNELFVDDVQPIDLKYIKAPIIQSTKLKTEDIPSKCVGYSITDEAFIKVEEEDLLIGNDLSSDSLPKTRLQASRLPKAQTISSGNTHDESATKATGDRETGHRRKKYGRLSSRPFAKSCTRKNAAKVSRKNKIDDIENNLGKPNRREQSASFQSRQDKGAAGVNNNVVHYKSKDISIISVQSTEPKSSLDDDIIASQNGVSFKRIMDTPLQKKNTSSDLQAKVSLKSSGDFSLDGISLQHIVELSSTIPSLAKEISFKPLPTNFQPPEINTSCSRKPEQTASPMQLPDIIDIHLEDNNAKKMACAVTVNPIKPNPMPLERTKRSVEINSDLFGNGNYMDLGNDVNMQNISDKNRQNLEFLQNSSHTKLYSEHSYVKQQPRLQPKVPQICNYERSNNVGENEFSDHLEHNYRSLIKSSLYEKKSAPLNSSHVSKISALDSVALVPLGRACETMSNAALLRAVRPSLAKQSKIGERENKELLENESVNSQIYLGSKGLPTKSALRQNENGEHCSKRILTDSGNESLAKKAKGSCKRRDREVSSAEAHQTEADDDWEGSNSIYKDFESRIQTQNRNMHNLSHQSMQHYDRFLNEYSEKAKKQVATISPKPKKFWCSYERDREKAAR